MRIKEHVGENDEHSWHPYDCQLTVDFERI
jgi:hypothetical protein